MAGFFRIAQVGKLRAPTQVHRAGDAGRAGGAVRVADTHLSDEGPAHAAPMGKPLGAIDDGLTVGFRGAVILVEDRAPPVDHGRLHRRRAGGRGVDRIAVGLGVEGLAPSLGQAKQADEHGGHPLAMGDGLGFQNRKGRFGVEGGQDLRRAAEAQHHVDVAQGCAVVKRRRGEIHGVLI